MEEIASLYQIIVNRHLHHALDITYEGNDGFLRSELLPFDIEEQRGQIEGERDFIPSGQPIADQTLDDPVVCQNQIKVVLPYQVPHYRMIEHPAEPILDN